MSYITAGGTAGWSGSFIGVPSGGSITPPPSGFVFSYDLSALNGNGMLNLLMFG